ncbi:MAG: LysM peptidoglycan-binding domain-containing protein [Flavobacteriales bacterium]|nr:LysM peptidoglycan-binding domain-containing protein [Flavobacteriales bacterium]
MANNISKLKIVSQANLETKKPEESMDALLNPESYNQKIEIKYSERQAPGTTGRMPKFTKIEPDKLDFELLFDRTGTINNLSPGEFGVDEDISKLKSLTVEYKGKEHRPRFVSIYWGTMKFDGCLETMDISYKLFNMDGLPLRAVVKTTFIGSMTDELRTKKESPNSPDMTHIRTVKFGDTLPLMCHDIYGDSKYYAAVAAHNRLDDFRNLTEGMQIQFPPLK